MTVRSRTPFVVGVFTALTLLLAACEGESPDASKATAPSIPPSAAVQSSEPVPTPSAEPTPDVSTSTPHGIVWAQCSEDNTHTLLISFVDPATGNSTGSRTFVVDEQQYSSYGPCGVGPVMPDSMRRSAIDRDYNNISVNTATPNDGYHTGVIASNETGGAFTDLSGIDETKTKYAVTGQQSPGAFGLDGKLYFVHATPVKDKTAVNGLMKVDPTTKVIEKAPFAGFDAQDVNVPALDVPLYFGVYFLPGYSNPLTQFSARAAYSANGSWMFAEDGDNLYYGNPANPQKFYANGVNPIPTPFAYKDTTSYYGMEDGEIVLAKFDGTKVTTKSLLPVLNGQIIDPTLSPDGKTIAFILKQKSGSAMLTVSSAVGDEQPNEPNELSTFNGSDARILEWIE